LSPSVKIPGFFDNLCNYLVSYTSVIEYKFTLHWRPVMSGLKSVSISTLLLSIVIICMIAPASAEFVPLLGEEHFEYTLRCPNYRTSYMIEHMDPSEAASRHGIIFTGEGKSSLTTHKAKDNSDGISTFVGGRSIEQVPVSWESSAGEGIVIRFKYPVSKFGVRLSHDSDDRYDWPETGSLRAYSVNAQLIGTVEVGSMPSIWEGQDRIETTNFGFETTSSLEGVTTVVLDYGDSEVPERIRQVYYEYVNPKPFKVILPQLAHGTVSGASIECDLFIYWDHSVTIRTYSPDGGLLDDPILKEGSNFTLLLEDTQQFLFKSTTIPGTEDLTTGFVKAESDYPVDGQVVYRTIDSEGIVHEADIRACTEETFVQTSFEINQAEQLNAALTIVNPSNTYAWIEMHVYDLNQSYTRFLRPPRIALKPWEQRSVFMWELWDEMPSFDGPYTIQLRSPHPFTAAAFYTRNWIVVGNLPMWSYKEGQAR
jgi:hypothetical protein